MIDAIIKAAIAIGTIIFADEVVKETTGKHIHQHIGDWFASLKNKAESLLAAHPEVYNIYCTVANIVSSRAAAVARGLNTVKIALFGKRHDTGATKIVSEEEIPLDQVDSLSRMGTETIVLAC